MSRVAVAGISGRMGTLVAEALDAAPDLELVVGIDPVGAPTSLAARGSRRDAVPVVASFAEALPFGVEVLVDFTVAPAARETVAAALRASVSVVLGTSGLSSGDLSEFEALATASEVGCFYAPNFALGAVLLVRFAAQAARYFPGVEVVELHHDRKVDAPSGTARHTVERLAAARAEAGLEAPSDATTTVAWEGARGATGPGGIHVHSVRLPSLLAHEEVLLSGPGELLTLRHDSFGRSSFMGGVLLAVREVQRCSGLVVGLDQLLDQQ